MHRNRHQRVRESALVRADSVDPVRQQNAHAGAAFQLQRGIGFVPLKDSFLQLAERCADPFAFGTVVLAERFIIRGGLRPVGNQIRKGFCLAQQGDAISSGFAHFLLPFTL